MPNAIMNLQPYWHAGTWVFDDEDAGLVKEPFVAGADVILSRLVEQLEIPDAKSGFRLTFSANPFPGHQLRAEWLREETPGMPDNGNWYRADVDGQEMEGWLCPALFEYFDSAPRQLFIKAEQRME